MEEVEQLKTSGLIDSITVSLIPERLHGTGVEAVVLEAVVKFQGTKSSYSYMMPVDEFKCSFDRIFEQASILLKRECLKNIAK